jgi:transposase
MSGSTMSIAGLFLLLGIFAPINFQHNMPHTQNLGQALKEWLCGKEAQIELVFLPPYAPESNPDEYLNHDFKTALRTGPLSRNIDELLEKAKSFMKRIASLPDHVMAYFRHPAAAYAAQGI